MTELERQQKESALVLDYHRTFNSEQGARVLAHLQKIFDFLGPVFSPMGSDAVAPELMAAKKDGSHDVIRHVVGILNQAPSADGNLEKPEQKVKVKR